MELTAENFPIHASELAARYPELGEIVERFGIPKFWARRPGLDSLVKIILEQQISVVAADTIHRRLRQALGGMSARRLCEFGPEALRSHGLTRQKSRYCYELGRSIVERRLSLRHLNELSDLDAMAVLVAQPGIGPWTASIYLMSALGRIDVWPPGDLALRVGVASILPDESVDELGDTGMRWRPKRAVAARLVWHHYRQQRNSRS